MKVISRTLLTLATGAAGVLTMPALGTADPGVHLVTSIEALSHAPDGVRYVVTVRPVGGPAHATTLVLSTRRPAVWTAAVPDCLSSEDRTALACDLGDVRESEPRTLHLTARPGDQGPAEVPVIAQAGAANAPSVMSSLGVARPAVMRLKGKSAGEPPLASPDPSQEPSASASPDESPPVESPPVESPSAAPSESEVVQSPDSPAPAVVRPPGAAPTPFARPRAPHRVPAARPPAPARVHPPAVPRAPVIPHMPIAPVAPVPPAEVPAGPPPNGPLGGPAAPLPIVSPVLPQIAPHPSPGSGISELDTLSPAGAMQAGRTSWATLIAIAVVAEAGLLWLIAGFTVWRRKRMPKGGVRLRALSRRLIFSRLIP
jgi:hypothetical protein